MPRYKNSSYPLIERSHAEFERLFNTLTYSNPECIVPALPFSSSSYQATEDDERRIKHSMQQWVNRVAMNPVLCHDEELRSFIETDFAVSFESDKKSISPVNIIQELKFLYFSLSQLLNHGRGLVVLSLSSLPILGMRIKHWFMPNQQHIF